MNRARKSDPDGAVYSDWSDNGNRSHGGQVITVDSLVLGGS